MPENSSKDFWIAIVAFVTAMIYAVKHYDELEDMSKPKRVRKLVYGMTGSALTTWCVYEILIYFAMPERLSLALGGACGYLGAEVVSRIILGFIEKKIDRQS